MHNELDKIAEAIKTIKDENKSMKGITFRTGVIACPVCSGELHYGILTRNNTTIGKCSTPNCIHWME